ncbi:phenylalanyl-tRNA synthetase alpha chain [Bacilli bacterium PM5-3]|nr:phenylalanyl-tRNA synthetase alpha chain [Bacilli bacterium PM5-3]MDH6602919.1 phenylalanyl-tRNA synthetase alpha chain [Bacilli bacterium PM5-9]
MLEDLKLEIINQVNDAKTLEDLKQVKVDVLGKKGSITALTKTMKDKTDEEKKTFGKQLHELKEYTGIILEQKEVFLNEKKIKEDIKSQAIDIFLPRTEFSKGSLHPLSMITNEIESFFRSLGYSINEGNEIEEDKFNFEMLNIPKNHPARDMQDTFYFNAEELLRTHTSPVQSRTMVANEDKTTPVRMICPGKVYRRDEDDATHSHQFMQVEGLVVDKDISLADLKGTLELFARQMFGKSTQVRFRPSYFPFTEPSVEVDLTCHICKGKGCNVCKQSGWIEILGAGQVHPNVIENAGYDPDVYQGFAFGMGIERIAMLKYGIDDIRHFYGNNVDFLNQFDKVK